MSRVFDKWFNETCDPVLDILCEDTGREWEDLYDKVVAYVMASDDEEDVALFDFASGCIKTWLEYAEAVLWATANKTEYSYDELRELLDDALYEYWFCGGYNNLEQCLLSIVGPALEGDLI